MRPGTRSHDQERADRTRPVPMPLSLRSQALPPRPQDAVEGHGP